MQPGQAVVLWIHDAAAKLFLGLDGERPIARWGVVGKVLPNMSSPIGVWLDVQHVEERRPGGGEIFAWGVHPGQCLIRWDYVITAQVLADPPKTIDTRAAPGLYL